MIATVLCESCRFENPPGMRFCGGCGRPLGERPVSAEHRQISVLFCDLSESTAISERLDLEALRQLIQDYQAAASEVVDLYGGHVAQYLGDGVLVYFGYPTAHEDDAWRAIRCGLDLVAAVDHLSDRLVANLGFRLAVRVGVHCGRVVAGEVGASGRREQLALGQTPNVAARLQDLASPNSVVASAAILQLVPGLFTCRSLGEQTLKGLSRPIEIFQVFEESRRGERFEQDGRLGPLVGREHELAQLQELFVRSRSGEGQVVVVRGEAGIGKSRLLYDCKQAIGERAAVWRVMRCSQHARQSAMYPVIELVGEMLGLEAEDSLEARQEKLLRALRPLPVLLAEAAPLLAGFLSLPPPAAFPSSEASPSAQRKKTLELLMQWLLLSPDEETVVLVVEDLHWADPSTRELVGLLVERAAAESFLCVILCRPSFAPPWPPSANRSTIELKRLDATQANRLIEHLTAGKRLPEQVLDHLIGKTDGVPLFVEELTKAVLESGVLRETPLRYELTGSLETLEIPATLQDSLTARLDRLGEAKTVAQQAAVIGREFSRDLLQHLTGFQAATLELALRKLVAAELLVLRGRQPNARYWFKHALLQEAAYQSLLRSTRQKIHLRIAEALSGEFQQLAEAQPELVAHHFTEARQFEPAVACWLHAGRVALGRSAYVEAAHHLESGLKLVSRLSDDGERLRSELALLTELGSAHMVTRGPGSAIVAATYGRAFELGQQIGDEPQLFPVLLGLYRYYAMRAEWSTARELSHKLLRVAEEAGNPAFRMESLRAIGAVLFHGGELATARAYLERGVALHDNEKLVVDATKPLHPGVNCMIYLGFCQAHMGEFGRAEKTVAHAIAEAKKIRHFTTAALALVAALVLAQMQGQEKQVMRLAEEVMTLAAAHGIAWADAWGQILHGWSRTMAGEHEGGLDELRRGMEAWKSQGAVASWTYFLLLQAQALERAGRRAEARAPIEEGLALGAANGERFQEAELQRLRGEVLLAEGLSDAAERDFEQALGTARRQGAVLWELRAALSLDHCLRVQGRDGDREKVLAAASKLDSRLALPEVAAARGLARAT